MYIQNFYNETSRWDAWLVEFFVNMTCPFEDPVYTHSYAELISKALWTRTLVNKIP